MPATQCSELHTRLWQLTQLTAWKLNRVKLWPPKQLTALATQNSGLSLQLWQLLQWTQLTALPIPSSGFSSQLWQLPAVNSAHSSQQWTQLNSSGKSEE
jgi:hypothetical protein